MATLKVRVKPNARDSSLESQPDGSWLAHVKAPPVDGRANAELIGLVARHFDVPKASVTVKSGAGARFKLIQIPG